MWSCLISPYSTIHFGTSQDPGRVIFCCVQVLLDCMWQEWIYIINQNCPIQCSSEQIKALVYPEEIKISIRARRVCSDCSERGDMKGWLMEGPLSHLKNQGVWPVKEITSQARLGKCWLTVIRIRMCVGQWDTELHPRELPGSPGKQLLPEQEEDTGTYRHSNTMEGSRRAGRASHKGTIHLR